MMQMKAESRFLMFARGMPGTKVSRTVIGDGIPRGGIEVNTMWIPGFEETRHRYAMKLQQSSSGVVDVLDVMLQVAEA